MSDAKEKLLRIYPHLMIAAKMAKIQVQDGTIEFAIMAKKQDGSGEIVCSFGCEEFLKDLGEVIGWEEILQEVVNTPFTKLPITGFQIVKSDESDDSE